VSSIKDRWKHIVERVENAALRAGRARSEITIVGVSKYVDAETTRDLYEAGCHDLGESRPQSLWDKATRLSDLPISWHMIGHLQRNKSKRTIPIIQCLHSLDSIRLAEQVNLDASELGRRLEVLLEVNVTGDATKTGLLPSDLKMVATKIVGLDHLHVVGLMGMAGLGNQTPREDFATIRALRDELQHELGTSTDLKHLSMGMSGDFEDAIAEGATMLRLGSVLFEGRE
jgi:PLP dependent protein